MRPDDKLFTVQDVVETAVEVGDDACCCYLCSRCGGSGRGGSEKEGVGEEDGDGIGGHIGRRLLGGHTNKEPELDYDDEEEQVRRHAR